MTLFVDTSVWSLAFRRDVVPDVPEVTALKQALQSGQQIVTTGLVLQELLQGFSGPKQRAALIEQFRSLPFLMPDREDHVAAADIRTDCRKAGVQVGTIDALLARLCLRNDVTMLSTDADFRHVQRVFPGLKVWR
jgi:predicted nucleic acid-binding protein